uniref:Secreted protein n=1 Tax=Anopheles darlingi TaxID=43151 RepID=A0A2M4D7F7_ANODA
MQKFRRKLTFFKSMKLILLFSQRSFAQVVHDLLGTGSLRFNCLLSFNSCRTNRKTHVRRFFYALFLRYFSCLTFVLARVVCKMRNIARLYVGSSIVSKKIKTTNVDVILSRKSHTST